MAASVASGMLIGPSPAAADGVSAPADNICQTEVAEAKAMPYVSPESQAQANEIVSGWTHNVSINPVTWEKTISVRDENGVLSHFKFTPQLSTMPGPYDNAQRLSSNPCAPTYGTNYVTEWKWWGVRWRLNRTETRDLSNGYMAMVYAAGVAVGCGACAVGAAIEGYWAVRANNIYNRGNCAYINAPYMYLGETTRGSFRNCM